MICLIGDLMLDHTYFTTVDRISPEAPVPVCSFQDELFQLGGAGNVAAGIKSLGGLVKLVSSTGCDAYGQKLKELLAEKNIETNLFSNGITTRKLRIKAEQQQLIRIDFEEKIQISESLINRIINEIKPDQIVVLSDYAKGMLDDSEKIISKSNQINCRVLVDPKSKDFSKYRGAWLLKPNFKEFTAAVGDCVDEADIHSRARELIDRYEIRNILITCGVKGMILVNHCGVQNFPAKSINVFDVTGAGDTVIAALATLLDSGKSLEDAIKFAIDAAACAVSKNGTQIVSILDIENLRKNKLSILTNGINLQGEEKIVFTNGCFDILHAGHVRLLEKAKELGTSLIVGLNSDNSVRRLKGNGRPINDQEKRKKVLSSLGCVDKVIIFEQDTPLELIKKIRPDVLVKGADYKITEIVGKDLVIKNGGIVKTIELVENLSTTKIVQDISNGK